MATWFRTGRGAALGAMVAALTIGSALPHLINGIGGVDWRPVVVCLPLLLTLAGGLIPRPPAVAKDGPYPFPRGVFDPRSPPRGVRLARARLPRPHVGALRDVDLIRPPSVIPPLLAERGWSDPGRDAALITFAVIAIGALGCVAGGLLGDRWAGPRIIALSLAVSGACAVLTDLPPARAHLPFVVGVGVVWGFAVIADSAQFSALVGPAAHERYVGTALTLQLALGFVLTVATIWLIPVCARRRGCLAVGLCAPGARSRAGDRRDAAPARLPEAGDRRRAAE